MIPGFQFREGSQETALAEEFSGSCTALDDRKLRLYLGAALFGIRPGGLHPVPHLRLREGCLHLFMLDTGKALLNEYQLSFVCFYPLFSLSYTVSLPFLIFCCQFVARIL